MKKETVEEFIARGGKVTVLPPETEDDAKAKMEDESWFDTDLDLDQIEEDLKDD